MKTDNRHRRMGDDRLRCFFSIAALTGSVFCIGPASAAAAVIAAVPPAGGPVLDWRLTYGVPVAAGLLLLGVLLWNVLLRRAVIKRTAQLRQELAQRKLIEEQLRNQEARLASIFKSSPVGIGLVTNRVLMHINDRICEMTGYSRQELIGQNARLLYPTQEDYDFVGRAKYDQIRQHGVGTVETRWRRKDGAVLDILLSSAPLDGADWSQGVSFTVLDITDRKQTEAALRANETFLQSVFDSIGDGITVLDTDYNIIRVNDWMEQKYADRGPLTGRKCYQVFQNQDDVCHFCPTAKALQTGQTQSSVVPYGGTPEAPEGWMELNAFPIRQADGRVSAVIEYVKDITDRIRFEQALKAAEQRKELALQGGDLGTWDWHIVTGEVIFNERWATMLGYTLDEIEPTAGAWEQLMHPDDVPFVTETLNAHLEGKTDFYETEHRLRHKAGHWVWVLDRGQVTERDADGRPLRACGTHLDITDRKQAEQEIRESRAYLYSVLNAAPAGIIVLTDRIVRDVNDQFCELFGYTRDELIGRDIRLVYPSREEYEQIGEQIYTQIRETGKGRCEARLQTQDGRILDILITGEAIDPSDWNKGITFALLDISETKLARQRAIAERNRAQQYLDIAAVMLVVLDAEGYVQRINQKGCDILDCTENQVQGRDWFTFVPEQTRGTTRKVFEDLMAGRGQAAEYYENWIQTLHGAAKLMAWHNTVIRDDTGRIIGTLSSGLDITEQRAAEEALTESEERFRNVIESSPMGIHMYELLEDDRLVLTGTNQSACEILEVNVFSKLGKTIEQAYPELVDTELPATYRRIAREGGHYHFGDFKYQDQTIQGHYEFSVFQTSPGKIAVMFTDVTDSVRVRRQLQMTQFAVDHVGEATFWMGPAGNFIYVNEAACRSLGYSRDALLTMGVHDIDPDFPVAVWQQFCQEVKAKKALRFESRHQARDGRIFPVEINGYFLEYEGREYIWAFVRDITEQRAAEQRLQMTQFAIDHAGEAAFQIRPDAHFIYVNEAACDMLGYSREELLTMGVRDIDPTYRPEFWRQHWRDVKEKKTLRFETRHKSKQGRVYPVEISVNYFDYDNREYIWTFVRDITESKRAEEAIRESENKHRSLFTAANDAIFLMERERFIECNPKAVSLYGCTSPDQLLNHSPLDYSPEYQEDGRRSADKAQEYLEGAYRGEPQRFSWVHHKLSGDVFFVEVSLARLELEGRVFLQAVVRDVTERRTDERARERLLRELQSKNEELEGIVFIASHDLRSPLVNIRGFTGELEKSLHRLQTLLAEEPLREAFREHLNRLFEEDIPESLSFIKSGNHKMDVLLNGLLRLSRVGSTQLQPSRVEMNAFLEGIVNSFLFRTRQSDIAITIDENLPPCMADTVLLNQVFTNLIDNAIKYRSPDRPAHIHIRGLTGDETVTYCIQDNGIGIAPEHLEKVFEIFHRLNPHGSEPGEGLGLTIVRRVLKRMDGDIRLTSTLGQGTQACIELPKA